MALLFWLSNEARAQVDASIEVDEIRQEARTRLALVDEFLRNQQWEEAVDTLRRVVESDGERMIRMPAGPTEERLGFVYYVPLVEYAQAKISSWGRLAPEALKLYRQRVDQVAEQWVRRGVAEQDRDALSRVAREMFASRSGDEALWWLGELALEQGDWVAARRAWESLLPSLRTPGGQPLWLALDGWDWQADFQRVRSGLERVAEQRSFGVWHYPDARQSPADLRARLVLVSILEGNRRRARVELDLLKLLHPEARGELAGQEGLWHELLEGWWKERAGWPEPVDGHWPTWAADAERNPRLPSIGVTRLPLWRLPLPRLPVPARNAATAEPRVAENRLGLLSYFPVFWEGNVLWQQSDGLYAVQADTGQPSWPRGGNAEPAVRGRFFAAESGGAELLQTGGPSRGVPRFTLSVADSIVLAHSGSPPVPSDTSAAAGRKSYLIGLDLETQKLLYRVEPAETGWYMAGSPLGVGQRVYAVEHRRDQVFLTTRVVAFDLATGRRIWTRDVCRGQIPANELVWSHPLLSHQGDTLYLNTHQGAVAALDAERGLLRWLTGYPQSAGVPADPDQSLRFRFRDLTPCVLYQGIVIVAPADTDRILGLSATTGRVLWTSGRGELADVVHVLGVARETLLVSGDRLYWLDVYRGPVRAKFPDTGRTAPGFARGAPRGVGRGLIAGDRVFWPTPQRIFILDVRGPRLLADPLELSPLGLHGGSLAWEDGILVMASERELVAFAAPQGQPAEVDPTEFPPMGAQATEPLEVYPTLLAPIPTGQPAAQQPLAQQPLAQQPGPRGAAF